MANFSVNGVAIKNPSAFKIERYNITNMERLADAKMVGDLIAKKRKFYFTYEAITGYDLNVILEAIWETDSLFFTLNYVDNGVAKTATVYVGSIPTDLHKAGRTTNWVWKNVTFNLIEQ
ncbi:MAG: hypothetical protein WCQ63_05315 [Methanomethylophilus sp.]